MKSFNTSKCETWFLMFSVLIVTVRLDTFVKFVKLLNEDVHFVEKIGTYDCSTGFVCAILCSNVENCFYAGFDKRRELCFLHNLNATSVTGTGRVNYLKLADTTGIFSLNMDLMTGATAWQSSTYEYTGFVFLAEYALDGDFNPHFYGHSCAITNNYNYSYWAMEFGMAGVVSSVDIYLRSDYVARNTKRSVLVAQTQEDATNNIGTICGGYFGPVIDLDPFKLEIQCTQPTYGKFLRITYEAPDIMEICEVVVHTL